MWFLSCLDSLNLFFLGMQALLRFDLVVALALIAQTEEEYGADDAKYDN